MTEPQELARRALEHAREADEVRLLAKGWQRVPIQTLSGTKMLYAAPGGAGTYPLTSALAVASLARSPS